METFKRYSKAIWFSVGWFITFVMMQTFYMVVALLFKMITDTDYLITVQQLLEQVDSNDVNALMNAYMEIIGSVTSYIEIFLAIGMSGLFVIDREIHKERFALNKIKITDIPQFITLGILMNIISTIFINMFSYETLVETGYSTSTSLMLQGGFFGILIGVGICAPICEEIAFRYFIYHNLSRGNRVLAIIASSLLFGLAHGNILQGFYAFVFGIVFTLFNIKYNSIIPSLIMHISVNSLSVVLVSVESAEMQILLMAMIFLLSLIPTSIILISRIVKHKKNTVEQL